MRARGAAAAGLRAVHQRAALLCLVGRDLIHVDSRREGGGDKGQGGGVESRTVK
jgi:hypothetical protein